MTAGNRSPAGRRSCCTRRRPALLTEENVTEIETPTLATRVVLDVLLERKPPSGPFRMHAVAPEVLVPPARRVLADRFRHLVPDDATPADVPRIAATIAPLIGRTST